MNWIFYISVGIGAYLWLYCALNLSKAGLDKLRGRPYTKVKLRRRAKSGGTEG